MDAAASGPADGATADFCSGVASALVARVTGVGSTFGVGRAGAESLVGAEGADCSETMGAAFWGGRVACGAESDWMLPLGLLQLFVVSDIAEWRLYSLYK